MQRAQEPVWFREHARSPRMAASTVSQMLVQRGQAQPEPAFSPATVTDPWSPDLTVSEASFEDDRSGMSVSEYSPSIVQSAQFATRVATPRVRMPSESDSIRTPALANSTSTASVSNASDTSIATPTSPTLLSVPPPPMRSLPTKSRGPIEVDDFEDDPILSEPPAADRRVPSYLGPKTTIHGTPPWMLGGDFDPFDAGEGGKRTGRSRSRSVTSTKEAGGALRGLGLGVDAPPSPRRSRFAKSSSEAASEAPFLDMDGTTSSRTPLKRKNSVAASVKSAASTIISGENVPAVPALPAKPVVALISAPVTSGPAPTVAGPGFSLIPLDVARNRERERIAAAAAAKAAEQPPPSDHFPPSPPATPAAPSRPTLKNKKSNGLLKLFGKGSREPSPALPAAPDMAAWGVPLPPTPTIQSAPAAQSSHALPPVPPSPKRPSASRTRATSRPNPTLSVTVSSPEVSFTTGESARGGRTGASSAPPTQAAFLETPGKPRLPRSDTVDGLAPSLSLRPVSALWSSAIPVDFLADIAGSGPASPVGSDRSHSFLATDSASSDGRASPAVSASAPSTPFLDSMPMGDAGLRVRLAELESHIRLLQAELDHARGGSPASPLTDDASCERCGCTCRRRSTGRSVVQRPRPKPDGTAGERGGLFSSGRE